MVLLAVFKLIIFCKYVLFSYFSFYGLFLCESRKITIKVDKVTKTPTATAVVTHTLTLRSHRRCC